MKTSYHALTSACCALLLCSGAQQAFAQDAEKTATYCDSSHPQVHVSGNLVWCADPTFWAAHAADVQPFYAWGDKLLPQLQSDFGLTSNQTFYIVVDAPNGGASTPTPYGPGINITGDAFYGSAYGINGFWAYLLITHEFVNQWTGLVTNGGWPNDWWADHRSPFPNSMDAYLLTQLGQSGAAAAQKPRFVAGGDSADTEVVMFNTFMDTYGQFAFIQRFVKYLQADNMLWGNLRDPPNYNTQTPFISGNPSEMLGDYVAAYLSLAAGKDLTAQINAAGVGQQPPSWPTDQTFTPYSLNATTVSKIADAHCAVGAATAQGQNASSALANLQKGNYGGVSISGTCGTGCPSECGCDSGNKCVAGFHAVGTQPTNPNTGTGGGTGSTSPIAAAPITFASNTGYCFDLNGANTTNGTQIQAWSCNSSAAQSVTYAGGQLKISGKCVQAAGSTSGSLLSINDCSTTQMQQWVVQGQTIALANTNVCIDVPNNAPSNGTRLQAYTCNGTAAQKWNVGGVKAASVRPSGNTGLCLDVRSSGTADGTPIQVWACNGTGAQTWTYGGGRLSALGHCAGVTSTAQGTAVDLYSCTETNGITWVPNGSSWQLYGTSQCLDLPNNNLTQGQTVRLWACNGSAAQHWSAK